MELELLILGDDERQLLHDFSGEWRHCPESLCKILCAMCVLVLEKDFLMTDTRITIELKKTLTQIVSKKKIIGKYKCESNDRQTKRNYKSQKHI